MTRNAPKTLEESEVILRLGVEVAEDNRPRFLAFCERAFPIYESYGGCRMMLYADNAHPGRFDEVGYYATLEDYRRSEKAIEEDPVQAGLIKEWKTLLEKPPTVSITTRRRLH